MFPLLTAELQGDLAHVAERLRCSTVLLETAGRPRGHGAGIIWSDDGLLVTNAHVARQNAAMVTLADGTTGPARLVARDPRRDIALLRLDAGVARRSAIVPAAIGDPSTLHAGDVVLALGHPLGVPHALALGVVHTLTRSAKAPYVVADIALAPGNSGGPLADVRGRVVGVNCMVVGGLGLAVSVDAVRRLVAAVQAKRAA